MPHDGRANRHELEKFLKIFWPGRRSRIAAIDLDRWLRPAPAPDRSGPLCMAFVAAVQAATKRARHQKFTAAVAGRTWCRKSPGG